MSASRSKLPVIVVNRPYRSQEYIQTDSCNISYNIQIDLKQNKQCSFETHADKHTFQQGIHLTSRSPLETIFLNSSQWI